MLDHTVERLISNGFRLLFKCFLSSRIDHSTRLDRFLGTLRHKWSTHYSKIAKYVKKSNQQKSVEYFIYHAKKLTFYLFSTHYFLPNLNLISLKQTISQWIITKIFFKRQKKVLYTVCFLIKKVRKRRVLFKKRRRQSTFVAAAEETKAFPVTPPVPLDNRRSIPEKRRKKGASPLSIPANLSDCQYECQWSINYVEKQTQKNTVFENYPKCLILFKRLELWIGTRLVQLTYFWRKNSKWDIFGDFQKTAKKAAFLCRKSV